MKFSRAQRLLRKQDYCRVCSFGQKYVGDKIVILYRLSTTCSKLGITITKKRGKAHERNRFKRVIREAYRYECGKFPLNIELSIHPRKGYQKLMPKEVRSDLQGLIDNCGNLISK